MFNIASDDHTMRAPASPPSPDYRRWRRASLVEGGTLLLLVGVAVPLKHAAGDARLVGVLGPVHGLAFVYYLWVLAGVMRPGEWRWTEVLRAVVAAAIPLGNLANVHLFRRKLCAPPRPGEAR
ncbi:DUF3817 domain-containing protein [Eleftheria terrae]|uniref:DUF3817 domain-containing protein n=1 Tax=Eleftheria terrae TaxID=1597781 RepID=UPI00263A9CA1|nr:DUF3817 domain-containing protein [Eleftheria terrae]WKB55420.1 DUF3817 domain-containing protein [Eleftheria terrae]